MPLILQNTTNRHRHTHVQTLGKKWCHLASGPYWLGPIAKRRASPKVFQRLGFLAYNMLSPCTAVQSSMCADNLHNISALSVQVLVATHAQRTIEALARVFLCFTLPSALTTWGWNCSCSNVVGAAWDISKQLLFLCNRRHGWLNSSVVPYTVYPMALSTLSANSYEQR